jgi:tetratricopeptide (TPR) repeat protein
MLGNVRASGAFGARREAHVASWRTRAAAIAPGARTLPRGLRISGGMEGRLDSWKEIASHFGRRVRTVQRWEKEEGMPVHRHAHRRRGTVYALVAELDAWWRSRTVPPGEEPRLGAPTPEAAPAERRPDLGAGVSAARAAAWSPAPWRETAASPGGLARRPAGEAVPPGRRWRAAHRIWAASLAALALAAGSLVAARVAGPEARPRGAAAVRSGDPDRVLQARYLLHRGSLPEVARAVALCAGTGAAGEEAALHECRAQGLMALVRHGRLPLDEGLRRVRDEAERALALDPGRAEALVSATWARYAQDWDRDAAESGYRRAAALDPRAALPRHRLAHLLSTAGRHDEAIAELRLAQRAEPLSAALNDDGCWFFYRARHHAEAIEEAQRALLLEPERPGALECVVDAASALGDHAAARAAAVTLLAALRDPAAAEIAAAPAAEARDRLHLRLLARLEREEDGPGSASAHAFLNAELGRRDEALAWLERSIAAREGVVLLVRVHPAFDSVRGDPRLEALLRRAGV